MFRFRPDTVSRKITTQKAIAKSGLMNVTNPPDQVFLQKDPDRSVGSRLKNKRDCIGRSSPFSRGPYFRVSFTC